MNITKNENGDLVISNFEGDFLCSKKNKIEYLEQFVRLMDFELEDGEEASAIKRALTSLLNAGENAEKQDVVNELIWLNDCYIHTKMLANLITERAKSDEAEANDKNSQEEPAVINCPTCGGTAKLMYRGYLPFYVCSQCGREGELAEQVEDAAYQWNISEALSKAKKAIEIAERSHVSVSVLNRVTMGILEQIYKEKGILHGE